MVSLPFNRAGDPCQSVPDSQPPTEIRSKSSRQPPAASRRRYSSVRRAAIFSAAALAGKWSTEYVRIRKERSRIVYAVTIGPRHSRNVLTNFTRRADRFTFRLNRSFIEFCRR